MPKRYFCYYCDKSFQDTPKGRDKHMKGVSHQRMRKHYYESVMVPLAQMEANVGAILYSGLSGEQILHLWLQDNPQVYEAYKMTS